MTIVRVTDAGGSSLDATLPLTITDAIIDPPPPDDPGPIGPPPTLVDLGPGGDSFFDILILGEIPGQPRGPFWDARYARQLSGGYRWFGGDRVAYTQGVYMSLRDPVTMQAHARVTFHVGYGPEVTSIHFDRYMDEGAAWYDGTVNPDGSIRQLNDTPIISPVLAPFDGDHRPQIDWYDPAIVDADNIAERRSYAAPLNLGPGVTFSLIDSITEPFTDQGRVSAQHTVHRRDIVGQWKDGKLSAAVYYDLLTTRLRAAVVEVPAS